MTGRAAEVKMYAAPMPLSGPIAQIAAALNPARDDSGAVVRRTAVAAPRPRRIMGRMDAVLPAASLAPAPAGAAAETGGDEALMLAYAAGDAAAFSRLFERHERPVFRFLLRSLGTPALAEEVLQEVWIAVVRNAQRYEPRAKFTTWLYGIARTKLIDHWRAHDPTVSLDEPAVNDPDASLLDQLAADATTEPQIQALARAQAREFMRAVEALPPPQREVFLLHADGGLSLEDVARITGVGIETAKSRFRYALGKLRAAMQEWR